MIGRLFEAKPMKNVYHDAPVSSTVIQRPLPVFVCEKHISTET